MRLARNRPLGFHSGAGFATAPHPARAMPIFNPDAGARASCPPIKPLRGVAARRQADAEASRPSFRRAISTRPSIATSAAATCHSSFADNIGELASEIG